MSVVVAVRDEDKIWLATDSQVTSGWTKSLISSQHSFKIFKMPHNLNIGGVGSLRDLNIISTSDIEFISENAILKNDINFKSIVRDTVPKLFTELAKFGRVEKEFEMLYLASHFILAHGIDCYMICGDGAVMELNDMFAIGSGADVAESAYTVLRDVELSPKEMAVRAVMSSCERDLFVDYPIIVTNTLMNTFELFDGTSYYNVELNGELTLIEEENEEEIEGDSEEEEEEICEEGLCIETGSKSNKAEPVNFEQ